MNDEYGIGDAQQFFGTVAPWAQNEYVYGQDRLDLENLPAYISGQDRLDLENLPAFISGEDRVDLENLPAKLSGFGKVADIFKNIGGKALNFAQTPQGIMALLAAFAALRDRQGKIGGGAKEGMMAPRQFTRSVDPMGIVRYAANGGLMQAYAQGGAVRPFPMQDGGFVMTADAVKGAEKLADGGITSLLPDAKMIRGPGTGTSDDIPAYIQGPNGRTPAKLSNGEAYVPPGRDTEGLYALMRELERKA
jgi:hypothetical protein